MFSLCYAQCLSYLFHIMFPSPSILQHDDESDTHTIVTVEKLLRMGFCGGYVDHLAHHQTIISTFSGGLGLLSII